MTASTLSVNKYANWLPSVRHGLLLALFVRSFQVFRKCGHWIVAFYYRLCWTRISICTFLSVVRSKLCYVYLEFQCIQSIEQQQQQICQTITKCLLIELNRFMPFHSNNLFDKLEWHRLDAWNSNLWKNSCKFVWFKSQFLNWFWYSNGWWNMLAFDRNKNSGINFGFFYMNFTMLSDRHSLHIFRWNIFGAHLVLFFWCYFLWTAGQ